MRVARTHARIIVSTLALMLVTTAAQAAPLGAFGGFDHYAGAFGQRTDGWVAGLELSAAAADAAIAGVRYDDTLIGRGTSVTGAAGFAMAPMTQLRFAATRFIGDQTFRAWRARVGPRFSLPSGQSLWLSYVHYQDDAAGHSDGATAEAATLLIANLTGRANASYATAVNGPPALQGSLGLGWRVVPHLELSGELGLARNRSGATGGAPVPGGGVLGIQPPLIGGGGNAGGESRGSVNDVSMTASLGVRVFLP
jgi:hypothetical protein